MINSTKPTNGTTETGHGVLPVCPAATCSCRSSVAEGDIMNEDELSFRVYHIGDIRDEILAEYGMGK